MKIICAPDSFKESLTATEAAEAMAAGIRETIPDAVIDLCPIADGGEGTLSAFTAAMDGNTHPMTVSGPLGDSVEATIGIFHDGKLAVVESAAAAGLHLVARESRNPERSCSHGVGELVAAACVTGATRIIVGVGGTATNDGGCGMAQALGVRFFDRNGALIDRQITGADLQSIAHIDGGTRLPALKDIDIVVASDVQNPLTGPDGATTVYGPQKGATDEQVARLDAGLANLAELVRRDLGIDIDRFPGAGSGGGLGGGLAAFAGARIESGIDTVLAAVEFEQRVRACQLCLTGEGKIDAQSLSGKACMGVVQAASRHGVPTVALVGSAGAGAEQCLDAGLDDFVVIGEGLPAAQSIREASTLLASAAGRVAPGYVPGN